MFRAAPMLQLSVLVLERDQRAVLWELGRLGAVQLAPKRPGLSTAPLPPRDRSGELANCNRLLVRCSELHRDLAVAAVEAKSPMTLGDAERMLDSLEARAGALLRRRESLVHRLSELYATQKRFSPFCGLGLPLDAAGRFEMLHFILGAVPPGNLESLQREIGDPAALLPLAPEENRLPVVVLTTREHRQALGQALERVGFQAEELPELQGETVDTFFEDRGREKEAVAAELKGVQQQIQELAAEAAEPLAAVERLALQERCLLEAVQNCPRTEAAFLLSGWVPADAAPAVERRLREVTTGRCVCERTGPEEGAGGAVPVLLRHPRLLRPFERLVAAYGLPQYRELEPTLFVALSFVLMFGMMFGDVGHGFLLAAGGAAALAKVRKARARDAGVVLLFAGVSSMVFGIVYGSYFGLTQWKRYALWHDPIEGDPMALMRSGIGVGVVMISLGLIFNMINRFRSGDVLGGFLDKFGVAGALFYWGMLAWATQFQALKSQGLAGLMLALCLAVPAAGWTLKGPLELLRRRRAGQPDARGGGVLAAGAESLVEAFEASLSYLANTISFVRLAAYAMSHSALLAATLMMAAEVRRASVAGSVLVVVAGNLATMVLEAVVASVQALRLEYYEFFGKFFSGGGEAFKPFRLVQANDSKREAIHDEHIALDSWGSGGWGPLPGRGGGG